MGQVRFHARGSRRDAQALYERLDVLFGEDGSPVAITEIDEAADIHEVSVYFEEAGEVDEAGVVHAFAGFGCEREDLPEIDWMAQVLADLKPVRAGRFLVHGAHDRDRVRSNDLAIEIEAGQAFGTGHHGTTAGCLSMIETVIRRRRPAVALDLGTGSAVLAIAIAKLARVPVLATDIDPVAVAVARENVRANQVHDFVTLATATGFSAPAFRDFAPFDLVVANILAGPLMRLAPVLARHLAPAGDVILSGILARQRNGVLAAYRQQGLFHHQTLRRDEWVTLHLRRNLNPVGR
ncbi:50S ribosomal protein L11 methyltransferase [Aureimonas pseudogalii]|uniref:Ribosomal protein L11 methyltransferase n=1 Tax=Aureimonas pseudogalii TaxID=1744844 RepID=A0A7W6MKY3_9HYPH|nr:50S ribosomal protein L11 methyltransferase [Aureimonas pseudogalii]MBB3999314.1 ribosomal protein L11 methyltransferase [Aureimonas pseudogalii]